MEIKKTFYREKQYEWKTFSPEELEKLKDDKGKVIFPEEKTK